MTTKTQNKQGKTRTIRVSDKTLALLDMLTKNANKKKHGSKIFPDQLIAIGLAN